MYIHSTNQDTKIVPQRVGGTITISNGEEIHIDPDSIKNNESSKSSAVFIEEFTKAIKEGIFQKSDDKEETNKTRK
ncbi:MAG TPA: hypothetical protein VLF89_00325 [Candidatus Saccharimonadales bacterium]|nr:hypothetical protein [Candidatus Saccharimonadales bacterium]